MNAIVGRAPSGARKSTTVAVIVRCEDDAKRCALTSNRHPIPLPDICIRVDVGLKLACTAQRGTFPDQAAE